MYNRVKFGYHFHTNYDLILQTAEFLELVKLCSVQSINAPYIYPRDFHEKMPATAEFRLRSQRGVAL